MKILFVTTISNTINAFLIPHIKLLIDEGHQVDIATNIVQAVNPKLLEMGCKVHNIEFQRSPLKKSNYIAYKKLKKLILDENYELIHTHTPIASVCVRWACRTMKNIKVFYTAHGFHFHKGAPIINWLIYYTLEKWLSKYTDVLITINKEDYERANKSFKSRKVEYIPGIGLDTNKFSKVSVDKLDKRNEIGLPKNSIILLSVGELNKNKNHETIIKAIGKLDCPDIYYVICGYGPLESYLINLTINLGIDKQIILLGYRKDIAEICKASDIFVFPSKREGLGLAALEAMASGLPLITSNVHGIVDYSIDGLTGFTHNPTDVDGFARSIESLIKNKRLRDKIGVDNIEFVKSFDIERSITTMREIYREELN